MAKTKKIISAGQLRVEVIYDRVRPKDNDRIRQAKRKTQSDAQARMNLKYSWQKLELLLAANFVPGDLVCVLTYRDACLPFSRPEATHKLDYFRKKLAASRRARGEPLRMVWNHEHGHGSGRYHHHVVINACGGDVEELRRLWSYGDVEIRPLRADGEQNYESLARYMCKEYPERLGQRAWSYSRSCRQPETETFVVSDDTELVVPDEAVVLVDEQCSNQYSSYHYVKMIAAVLPRAPRTRRKHRRRRRDK